MNRVVFVFCFLFLYIGLSAQTNTTPQTARELYYAGKYNEAITLAETQRRANPENIDNYIVMGWCYSRLGDYRNMVTITQQGLRIQGANIWLLINQIEAYFYLKDYNSVVVACERYFKYRGNSTDKYLPVAYYNLGLSFYYMRAYYKADITLSAANSVSPRDYKNVILLAEIKEALADYKKSAEFFTIAKEIQPASTRAIDGLARVTEKLSSEPK